VNELILNLLHKHDAHSDLFQAYEQIINELAEDSDIEPHLRQFEKHLFDEIGYGLSLQYEANGKTPLQSDVYYVYTAGVGAVRQKNDASSDAVLGSTLLNLAANRLKSKVELSQVKRMMRRLIDNQLDGKILKSRDLFV
jgi:DNA repair protein RecO (recombination protein O)